jgi:oligoendopeptidase F
MLSKLMDFLSYTPDYDDIADRYADLVDRIFKPQSRQTQPQKFNTYDQPENCKGARPQYTSPDEVIESGCNLLQCMSPEMARLRHADGCWECLFIGRGTPEVIGARSERRE